jgi:uncharacterized protein (DUF885 family)
MTQRPSPGATTDADDGLTSLIAARFDALMEAWPSHSTALGIHDHDGRLADLSRSAMESDIVAESAFIGRLEAIAPEDLSEPQRFERDLALHSARLRRFESEVVAVWRRGATASREVGDALFLLLARDFAPLEDRLAPMTQRLEGVPEALRQARDRMDEHPVRLWIEIEMRSASDLPGLIHEIVVSARDLWPTGDGRLRRLERAARATRDALLDYRDWLGSRLDRATGRVAIGSEAIDTLIGLRGFDDLSTDDILAIGHEQLEAMHEARREAGRAIDRSLSEEAVVDLVKDDGPADFETALAAYRQSMMRARRFVEERDLATLPADDVIEVLPTPAHMRNLIPLAAYLEPAAFDRPIRGVYIVTPSVDGDPGAMREHNWASIVNTSVHEAYPGHHHQSSAALASPSPTRLLTDAPEFHEGWAMYCEQMMLEEGFEDSPARRVIVATDAIWRACRIILDIELHRGHIGIEEAVDFLVEHTRFEHPVAVAEVRRYTQSPGYNLSYLLGKVQLLQLREQERQRLGSAFSLRRFHDALLYSGDLPVSFHRRLLAGEGGGPTMPGSRREA